MGELLNHLPNTADAIVVGGGSLGLHAANNLYERMGKNTRILLATQENEWGGVAGRSLEQFRMFNDSFAMAEIVDRSVAYYRQVEQDIRAHDGTDLIEPFPYIFTVGDQEVPENIEELLPHANHSRPTIEDYEKIRQDIASWGFSSGAHIMSASELQSRFPEIDGTGINEAMVVENAGKIKFDILKSYLLSRGAKNVMHHPGLHAHSVIMDKQGKAIGIDFGTEKIYSDKIILALGSFVINLASLLPHEESKRIASNFTVTQRELFFSKTPGKDKTKYFLISPDMAMVRSTPNEMYAHYGYAAHDDQTIRTPETDVRPDKRYMSDIGISHRDLFVARVYEMLAECSTKWDSSQGGATWAIEPSGHSAGYYTAYHDDLPVIGEIGDTGAILLAGAHHSGVMGGRGMAEIAVDHLLHEKSTSDRTYEETDINRTPIKHEGLIL